MPLVVTTLSVLICDTCGRSETHTAGSSSPDLEDWAAGRQWQVIVANDPTDRATTICPRCAPVVALSSDQVAAPIPLRPDVSNVIPIRHR